MNKKTIRTAASLLILMLTAFVFVWYLRAHPNYVTQLLHTKPHWILLIITSSLLAMYALNLLYDVLVRMTGKQLQPTENILLSIYSSIANFFGPLQSGPGVRAAYLKTKHKVSLRAYFLVTLLYYAAFASINAFCLLVGTRPWWQAILASAGAAGISYGVIRFAAQKRKKEINILHITPKLIGAMLVLTAIQVFFIGMRYYFALEAAGANVSIGQAISYTGAANFAVFVSITPDGVGIREAFLLFAQNIHHVSTHNIVAANIIDRATYVLFLAVLFLIALSLHAKNKLQIISTKQPVESHNQKA